MNFKAPSTLPLSLFIKKMEVNKNNFNLCGGERTRI